MENEKRIKKLSVIALIISIFGLTIAFLAMSKVVKITENGEIKDARWDVHFENLTSSTTGDAKINKEPKITDEKNTISDFEITLTKPNDSVSFCYDVVNDGTINAVLQSKIINGFNYYDSSEEKIKSIYISSDWDNDGITTTNELNKSNLNISIFVNMPKVLNKGQRKNNCTKISFNGNELPLGNIKLKITIQGIYVQK